MSWAVVSTMLAAVSVIALMIPIAQRIKLVDHPNARKPHLDDVPLVGGLGIFATFLIASFFFGPQGIPTTAFVIASIIIVAGGLLDDFLEVSPVIKLVFQATAVLLMCFAGGVSVQTVGALVPGFGPIELGAIAVPFTLLAAIGVLNAVNLSDGLDGLAGFQLAVAFAALAFLADRAGDTAQVAELLLLIACVAGFLVLNARVLGRKRASVFLGDAGAMFLGFAYVWFAIDLSSGPNAVMSPVTSLWLLAIPICDAVTMLIRRTSRGRSPFKADKEHLHHVLMMAGFTVGETVMIFTGLAIAAASVGVAGEVFAVPDAAMVAMFLGIASVYLWVILRSWTVMRFLRWSICRRRAVSDRRTNFEQRQRHSDDPPGGVERRSGVERRRTVRRAREDAVEQTRKGEIKGLVARESGASLSRQDAAQDAGSTDGPARGRRLHPRH